MTDIAYKLLTKDRTSRNGCKWEPGEWKETSGEGDLCGPGWLHFYSHPLLAVLLNPIHANIADPVLWECETGGERKDDNGQKHGRTRARIVRELPLPVVTVVQRVRFGLLCALESPQSVNYKKWAAGWLDGSDRTRKSARAAAATYAACAAACAAGAAAAARAAAYHAAAAAYNAAAAACAAAAAYRHGVANIDLIAIAEKAIADEDAYERSRAARERSDEPEH